MNAGNVRDWYQPQSDLSKACGLTTIQRAALKHLAGVSPCSVSEVRKLPQLMKMLHTGLIKLELSITPKGLQKLQEIERLSRELGKRSA